MAEETAQQSEREELIGELVASAQARASLYRMLGSLYFKEMDLDGLERLAQANLAGVVDALDNDDMRAGWQFIARYLEHVDAGTRLDLKVDFACAILAAGSYEERMATPYESVFTSESGLLMQEARDDVYRLMCEAGLAVSEELREPEDHLSFECQFMARLADRQAQALESGDLDAARASLATQREMHAHHLLNWVDDYTACLEKVAKTDFYRGVAALTRGFVHEDEPFIADSLAAVEELLA